MGARLGSMIAFRPRAHGLFGMDSTDANNRQQQPALQPVTNVTQMSNEHRYADVGSHNDHSMDTLPTSANIGKQHILHESQHNIDMRHRGEYPTLILDIKEHKQAALGAASLDDVYLDQISVDFFLDSVKKSNASCTTNYFSPFTSVMDEEDTIYKLDKALHESSRSTDVMVELKFMFEKQAGAERFDLIQTFHACKHDEGKSVSSYVLKMKGYVEQLERLGYVLSQYISFGLILNGPTSDFAGFYEKGLPKKAATPQVMVIKGGRIQKANKKSLNAKGKGKGTDIAKIVRKRPKPDKHGHETEKSVQEPRI
ncbi:hypothetical protein Tco_1474374 [Tanacetum coccineum]